MLNDLPDELIIEICLKHTRLDLYNLSFVNKQFNYLYWKSVENNNYPFHLPFIDSLLELYLYKLIPIIDIVKYRIKKSHDIRLFYSYLNRHIIVCKECDIKICDSDNIRDDSVIVYC